MLPFIAAVMLPLVRRGYHRPGPNFRELVLRVLQNVLFRMRVIDHDQIAAAARRAAGLADRALPRRKFPASPGNTQ